MMRDLINSAWNTLRVLYYAPKTLKNMYNYNVKILYA